MSNIISTVATGTNLFPVPNDFRIARGFERQIDTNRWITLRRFNFQERNKNSGPIALYPWGAFELTYRLVGSNIMIEPFAAAPAIYQLWYVPEYINLVLPSDTLALYMDTQSWCEYAVVDCAIKVLAKQNLDPSIFMSAKEALRQRIVSAANVRDAGGVKKIANIRFMNDYYGGRNY